MPRLIDADALIEQMEADAEHLEESLFKMATYAAINDVKHQPTIDPQRWIPCSERLPEPNEFVLVQNQNLQCFVFCMREEEVWYDYDFVYQNEGIIAWMPLPKPWRGEE